MMVGHGSKRKSVGFDLNLTPFIDVFSTFICFLLMSAVWFQVAGVPILQEQGSGSASEAAADSRLLLEMKSPKSLKLTLRTSEKVLKTTTLNASSEEALRKSLSKTLKTWGEKRALTAGVSSAVVVTHSSVPYSGLIATLDTLRENSIMNLGVDYAGDVP